MSKAACLIAVFAILIAGCASKPSKQDISSKLLLDYICNEKARVNDLKILKTEETESTGEPPIFRYTISGEIEWPDGCTESGSNTPPGTKEKFKRLITLYKTHEGKWE
jgi:hypothetical protein